MTNVDEIAEDLLAEAQKDHVALCTVSDAVRWDLGLSDDAEVKARTLDIVRILVDHGVLVGSFKYGNPKFYPWNERDADSIIARIDKEWDSKKSDPIAQDLICWFYRPKQ